MFTIKIQCKEHPKYMAVRIPRAKCQDCWNMFYLREMIERFQAGNDVNLGYLGRWLTNFL